LDTPLYTVPNKVSGFLTCVLVRKICVLWIITQRKIHFTRWV